MCITLIIKCLIIIDTRCKHEDDQRGVDEDPDLLIHWIYNNPKREAASFFETSVIIY